MINIPKGYILIKDGPATIVAKQGYEEPLLKLGISKPEPLIKDHYSADSLSKGRGIVPSIPVKEIPGTSIMIRKYLRGGLVRFINHDMFSGNRRPFDELYIGAEAVARNIPTAESLAAVSIKITGPLYKCYLITKELIACVDLPQYLSKLSKDSNSDFLEKKEQALIKTAETVKKMHDKGILHADLNMKNILVDTIQPENIYIIDWDKSVLKNNLTPSEKSSNTIRFCRSMAKLKQLGIPLTRNDQKLFLTSYWKNSGKTLTELEKLDRIVMRRKLFWKIFNENN